MPEERDPKVHDAIEILHMELDPGAFEARRVWTPGRIVYVGRDKITAVKTNGEAVDLMIDKTRGGWRLYGTPSRKDSP